MFGETNTNNTNGYGREVQYERITRILRQRIQRGVLRPGQRLVRRSLANELHISTIPVIEALYRLEHEGLVEHSSNIGARVRPLSIDQVEDDLILREAIESQTARLLVGRLGPAALADLRNSAARLDQLMQEGDARSETGMRAHAEFHLNLARLTGRRVLVEELRKVWSRRFMQLAWIGATMIRKVPPDWHRRLIVALATGDPAIADEAARYHIRRSPEEHDEVMRNQTEALEKLRMNWQLRDTMDRDNHSERTNNVRVCRTRRKEK